MKIFDTKVLPRIVNRNHYKGDRLVVAFSNCRDKVRDARAIHDHADPGAIGDQCVASGREAGSLLVFKENGFYFFLASENVVERCKGVPGKVKELLNTEVR